MGRLSPSQLANITRSRKVVWEDQKIPGRKKRQTVLEYLEVARSAYCNFPVKYIHRFDREKKSKGFEPVWFFLYIYIEFLYIFVRFSPRRKNSIYILRINIEFLEGNLEIRSIFTRKTQYLRSDI